MPKAKIMVIAFLVAFMFNVLVAHSASAAGWFIRGQELVGSEARALSTVAMNDSSPVLNVPALPLKLTCKGPLDAATP